ncbi:unnamed protein product, partial [Porites lobata]
MMEELEDHETDGQEENDNSDSDSDVTVLPPDPSAKVEDQPKEQNLLQRAADTVFNLVKKFTGNGHDNKQDKEGDDSKLGAQDNKMTASEKESQGESLGKIVTLVGHEELNENSQMSGDNACIVKQGHITSSGASGVSEYVDPLPGVLQPSESLNIFVSENEKKRETDDKTPSLPEVSVVTSLPLNATLPASSSAVLKSSQVPLIKDSFVDVPQAPNRHPKCWNLKINVDQVIQPTIPPSIDITDTSDPVLPLPAPPVIGDTSLPSHEFSTAASSAEATLDTSILSKAQQAAVSSSAGLSSGVGSGGQKESIFVRLSNKIKVLEQNLNMSTLYMEQLHQRYRKSVEELQKNSDKKVALLTNATKKAE